MPSTRRERYICGRKRCSRSEVKYKVPSFVTDGPQFQLLSILIGSGRGSASDHDSPFFCATQIRNGRVCLPGAGLEEVKKSFSPSGEGRGCVSYTCAPEKGSTSGLLHRPA